MRNFDERMTEIKGRSRMRIARRRHQITALCVPLVAALCVGGALLIPKQTTYRYDDTIPTGTTMQQYSGSVTVVNGNETVIYNSPDTVDSLRHLVSNLAPAEDIALDAAPKYNYDFTAKMTSLTTNYTIILETEDGSVHYKLLGNVLTNLDTDEKYALTDMQRAELLKLLALL